MSNYTRTTIDTGGIVIRDAEYRDELLNFAGADTYVKGTVLARSTVDGKLRAMAVGGLNETDIPKSILTYDVEATGAGDVAVRALVRGVVNKNRLVLDADGDDSNITGAILDQIRAVGITPIDVQQLAEYDN